MFRNDSPGDKKGTFTISEGPITSPAPAMPAADGESPSLPPHYGAPLLLAIARDPQTLFVCWSVDWPAAFSYGQPADRSAHLRVKSLASGKHSTTAVEPMSGTCAIPNLKPGESYSVELGYFAPENEWNLVAAGNQVTMPGQTADAPIDVATVPFHLTFERMLKMFRSATHHELVTALAQFQERAEDAESLSAEECDVLRAMDISPEDLRQTASYREILRSAEQIRERALENFGGSSPGLGFGGSSRAS